MKKKKLNRLFTALTVIALCFNNYAPYYADAQEPENQIECGPEADYENDKDSEETVIIDKDTAVEGTNDIEDNANDAPDMDSVEDEITFAGSGTESDPYIITNAEQVNAIRKNLKAHYLIVNDIDMSVIKNWEPIGDMYTPFQGVIDGQGHVLKNLKISYLGLFEEVEHKYFGFIAYMLNGKIEKLGIEDASYDVKYDHFYGDEYPFSHVAGIVGGMDASTLSECYFTGTIKNDVGYKEYARSGALVSTAIHSSIIKDCYSISNTSAHSYGINTMVSGGACWLEDDTTIENVYVMGDISTSSDYGYKYIAGLAASGGGYVKNSLNLLDSISVSGDYVYKDDIANFATVSNCFCYDKDSEEAKNEETYKALGWDFDSVWMIDSNDRPKLSVFYRAGEWYKDYEYTLDDTNNTITLTRYNGNEKKIVIPAKAYINGKVYSVIESIKPYYGQIYDEEDGTYHNSNIHDFRNVEYIKLEKGVRLPDDSSQLFHGCLKLTKLDISEIDTNNVTDMSYMFYCPKLKQLDVSHFDTSNVINMAGMFSLCEQIESIDVTGFDTSKVENMASMFSGCEKLKSLDLKSIDTSKVTNMSYMFEACISLESLDVSGFDTTNVESMYAMFGACKSLTSIDLSHFNTSKTVDMGCMFSECSTITALDLSSFDTRNATTMHRMFYKCESLKEIDLSSFEYYGSEMAYSELYDVFTDDLSLEYIKTPKYINPEYTADLPVEMYELIDGKTRGDVVYTDLVKAPANAVLVSDTYTIRCGSATDPQPCIDETTTELTLVKGQKFVLTEKDWKSSDNKVVNVKNGKVTVKKDGTAQLSREGQTISVTVMAPSFAAKSVKMISGEEKDVVLNNTGDLEVLYLSAAPDVAAVDEDGTVTALSKGSAVINAYVNGVTYKYSVKVADADTSKRDFTKTVELSPMQTVSIKLNGFNAKKASWSSDSQVSENEIPKGCVFADSVVKISGSGKLTAIGAGETTLTATGGSASDVTIKVVVAEPVEKTLHINVNSSKPIKLYGVKGNPDWNVEDDAIVSVDKNKVTAKAAGSTVLTAQYEGFTYKVTVYAEDITLTAEGGLTGKSNKYSISMKTGDTVELLPAKLYQPLVFKSNKSEIAYADEDGVLTARSAGTAKLTAKVNGKTITVTVKVTEK